MDHTINTVFQYLYQGSDLHICLSVYLLYFLPTVKSLSSIFAPGLRCGCRMGAFDQELKSLTILPAGLTCQDFLNFQTSATSQRKPTPLYLSIQFNRNTYICRKHFKKKYILFDCETYICSGGNDRDGRWLLCEPVFVASVKLIWNSLGLPSLVVKQQFIGRGFLVKDDLREQHNQIRQFAREDLKQPYQIAVCALNGSGNGREVW